MLRFLLICLFAVGAFRGSGAEELLRNGSFREGEKEWRLLRYGTGEKAALSFTGEGCRIDAPESDGQVGSLQLTQVLALDFRREYRVEFTVKRESFGSLLLSFRTGGEPRRNLGLARTVELPPGASKHSFFFSPLSVEEKDGFSEICFQLGALSGRTELSDISVTEVAAKPLKPGDTWKLFLHDPGVYDRIPDDSCRAVTVPFQPVPGKRHVIDFGKPGGQCAALYQEFDSAEEYSARLGFSADYFMEIFLNGKSIYSTMGGGNGSTQFSTSDHIVTLPVKKGRNLLAIRVRSGSGGWRLVYGVPERPVRYLPDDTWKAVNTDKLHIRPGSALDLSGQIEAPAGKYGRARLGADGLIEFEKRQGKAVRFHGFSSGIPEEIWRGGSEREFRVKADRYAAAVRRQGYNLFRMHGLDGWIMYGTSENMKFSPRYLDRWDYLIAAFKREGIYVQCVILSFGLYQSEQNFRSTFEKRNMHKMLFHMGNRFERERFRAAAEKLLNHVNPYTGLAWKDEPAIAFVEYYNEAFLGVGRYAEAAVRFPEDHKRVLAVWNRWLRRRKPELHSRVEPVEIPAASDPLFNDYARFLEERISETNRWCEKAVRKAGYSGLTTQNSSFQLHALAAGWETLQVVDNHIYFCHPSDWDNPGSVVGQSSAAGEAASYFRSLVAGRLAGRPQLVGEFNFCFWNSWQHEAALVFNAYAAYQNFSGLAIHSDPVPAQGGNYSIQTFSSGTNPVLRAAQFLSNMFFLRGDITPSPHLVTLNVPPDYLHAGTNGMDAVSGEQSKLALLCGFGVAFPGLPAYPGAAAWKAELGIAPVGSAYVESHGWHVSVADRTDRSRYLDGMVAELKRRGILAPENISVPSKGVFQSDTGELTLRARENLVKAVTPRTEAVTLRKGRSEQLGILRIESVSADACIGLTSIDNLPLVRSRRMVLVCATEMVNTGMELTAGHARLVKLGVGPGLMRTGGFEFSVSGKNADGWKLYALNLVGERTEALPLQAENGRLVIRLDTARLKNGNTPFFELVCEP